MLTNRMPALLGRGLPRQAVILRPGFHLTPFIRLTSTSLVDVDDDDAMRRIYIHGGGAKTIFIATHLSRLPNPPPITIIVHELPLIAKFTSTGKRLRIVEIDGDDHTEIESIGPVEMECYVQQPDEPDQIWSTTSQAHNVNDDKETNYNTPVLYPQREHNKREVVTGIRHSKPLPIFNLISNIRAKNCVKRTMDIRDRLSSRSTVLAAQKYFGVVEDLCSQVFQQPDHRVYTIIPSFVTVKTQDLHLSIDVQHLCKGPTFRIANFGHVVRYAPNEPTIKASQTYINNAERILANQWTNSTSLRIIHEIRQHQCAFRIGPVVPADVLQKSQREEASKYILQKLKSVAMLKTQSMTHYESIYHRTVYLVVDAVIGSLSALKLCRKQDLFDDETSIALGNMLLSEIWNVMSPSIDPRRPVELSHFKNMISFDVATMAGELHKWAADVAAGRDTDIDYINGWVVRRGQQLRPPVPCPKNAMVTELVKQKTEEIRVKIEARLAEKLKAREAQQPRVAETSETSGETTAGKDEDKAQEAQQPRAAKKSETSEERTSGKDEDKIVLDRQEVRRMKKAKTQREKLGKQPVPQWHAQPQMNKLGGK